MANPMAPTGSINRHYLTLSSYSIDPGYLREPHVKLGDGIDLRNPLQPEVAPYTAFAAMMMAAGPGMEERGLPRSSDVIRETTRLRESLAESEQASVLSTYFKASYLLSSVQGAYSAAKQEQSSYHTIYALLDHYGESDRLPGQLRHWRPGEVPASETIADPDRALMQFVLTYGSHYVSAIRYGLRVAVEAKLKRDGRSSTTEFSSAFKAAFGNFSAEAGARMQQKQKLEQMGVDLLLEATSGGHSGAGLLVLRAFDDIARFLDDVKNDKIQFSLAPIELTVMPYWATLNPEWKRTRDLLDPLAASFKTPGAPYGVPKGTVVAWHPMSDFVQGLQPGATEATIVPPDGWAVCDGTRGTPDLRGRFVRGGAGAWRPAIATGGSETHNHGGATKVNTAKRGAHGGAGSAYNQPAEAHDHAIEANAHLPPYAELVYIMKLDDVP